MERNRALLLSFLTMELVAYGLILSTGGELLVWSSFLSIVLCFLFALSRLCRDNRLTVAALGCTVGADFCLVLCDPQQKLLGMIFFLAVQSLYALWLHGVRPLRWLVWVRGALTALGAAVACVVLGEKTDALALVSVCYYVNLIVNLAAALPLFKGMPLVPLGLILFLLCDTVIGLQEMSMGYLPIRDGSFLHNLLFGSFPLAWFFYLPSQVLLALNNRKPSAKTK